MTTPHFNTRADLYEHPETVQTILESLQSTEKANNRYTTEEGAETSASYMRNMAVAVNASKILSLMDDIDHRFTTNFEPTPDNFEASTHVMEDAINDPSYRKIEGIEPSSANTVTSLSALHMAEIYDAWVDYHFTNFDVEEMERVGIGAQSDLNAFRQMAVNMIDESIKGLEAEAAFREVSDLQMLREDVTRQIIEEGGIHASMSHPVNKVVDYFSAFQGEVTPETVSFISVLDQRKAAIEPLIDDQEDGFEINVPAA